MLNNTLPWYDPDSWIPFGRLIVAFLALVLMYLGYRRASNAGRPNLEVQIERCQHTVRYRDPNIQDRENIIGTHIVVDFLLHNTSAKTTVHSIEIDFGRTFHTIEMVQGGTIAIGIGETTNYSHDFFIQARGVFLDSVNCVFHLHHTYSKDSVKGVSRYRR